MSKIETIKINEVEYIRKGTLETIKLGWERSASDSYTLLDDVVDCGLGDR